LQALRILTYLFYLEEKFNLNDHLSELKDLRLGYVLIKLDCERISDLGGKLSHAADFPPRSEVAIIVSSYLSLMIFVYFYIPKIIDKFQI
jgi:hypothetical protein